ncbi:MAG: SIR2 family protein [Candidatus Thiodiazotropha taylori]|nr:SIR2 family protein [Candidatus Thiodiazotropha taylori]
MAPSISVRSQREFYNSDSNIQTWLAESLRLGQLRLVLGAGASQACGLPDWKTLVQRISQDVDKDPKGKDEPSKSSWLLRHAFKNNRESFAKTVQRVLYEDFDLSLPSLTTKRLLIALGALSVPSRRGSVREIITFNFDDLLEVYLNYLGFSVLSTTVLPRWSGRTDIEVLHIHGLLPSNPNSYIPRNIVFTESDFDEVVGDRSDIWRKQVTSIMQSNICVFIGISGEDPNLRSILREIKKSHVSQEGSLPYWGIRFTSSKSDERNDDFSEYGILPVIIPHKQIPDWLLTVTQLAADN